MSTIVAKAMDIASTRRSSRAARLREQMERLYGPLYFFVSQNEALLRLNRQFHEAYGEEYCGKTFSRDEGTQEQLNKDTQRTLDAANAYVAMIVPNNDRIYEIMRDNYAYIDRRDIETFSQFMIDHVRLKTEFGAEATHNVPHEVYLRVGEVSFIRPAFIDAVRGRFLAINKELGKLTP